MPMTVHHFWFDHFLVFHHPAFEATDNGQVLLQLNVCRILKGGCPTQQRIPDFLMVFYDFLRFPNRR